MKLFESSNTISHFYIEDIWEIFKPKTNKKKEPIKYKEKEKEKDNKSSVKKW